jgi:hypothetical protein
LLKSFPFAMCKNNLTTIVNNLPLSRIVYNI